MSSLVWSRGSWPRLFGAVGLKHIPVVSGWTRWDNRQERTDPRVIPQRATFAPVLLQSVAGTAVRLDVVGGLLQLPRPDMERASTVFEVGGDDALLAWWWARQLHRGEHP